MPHVTSSLKSLRGIFESVKWIWVKRVGDVGHCGRRERWGASEDEDAGMVALRDAMGEMEGDAVYCVGSVMEVSDLLQEEEPDLGDEWRKLGTWFESSA